MIFADRRVMRTTLCLCSLLPLGVSAAFAESTPAAQGVLWESTSQMTMEGMSFGPPQTRKVCAPVVWTAPPGAGADRGCVSSELNRQDNVVTWTSACSGPPAMNGDGRIEFEDATAQAYTGEIHYATGDGNVVIKLNGRAAGPCDNPR